MKLSDNRNETFGRLVLERRPDAVVVRLGSVQVARGHELRGKHTVAGCRHSVLRHLEAAGNAADPGRATLCCAAPHLPAALPSTENPPAAALERILCAAPTAAATGPVCNRGLEDGDGTYWEEKPPPPADGTFRSTTWAAKTRGTDKVT